MDELKGLARRAYELGRLRRGLPWAALVALLGILGASQTRTAPLGVALALLAAAATLTCLWYGRQLTRGVRPGIVIGSLALLLTLWAERFPVACGIPCFAAGVLIPLCAVRTSFTATAAIATPLAVIACLPLGAGALFGLALGLVLGSVPLLVRRA